MDILKTKINNYIINTLSNDCLGISINKDGSWETHITTFLKRNLKYNSTLIDIGSNYGWHSISNSHLCKKIYSFEPQTYIFDIQIKNIKENNIANIECYNYALGCSDEIKEMSPINYTSDNINMGDLSIGFGGEKVKVKTLDSLRISNIDFIKIDVQGYEKYVLEGASNTILVDKPTIIIEIEEHQLNKFNYTSDQLFEVLKNFGYVIYLLDYHYPSDHVCVHRDNLKEFIKINNEYIKPLKESNSLNRNLKNGVIEKICQNK